MNKKTMEIKPGVAMGQIKPMFAGLPQDAKDSVKFECHYAKFDLIQNVLFMEKIPYIDVADSRVFPFEGKAIVREKAYMDRLDSSRIEANRNDKFHEIKNFGHFVGYRFCCIWWFCAPCMGPGHAPSRGTAATDGRGLGQTPPSAHTASTGSGRRD
jgi:hypothetical protein